jgi:hypothetical protein
MNTNHWPYPRRGNTLPNGVSNGVSRLKTRINSNREVATSSHRRDYECAFTAHS